MQQLCAILCQRLRGAAGRLSDSPPTFYSHTQRSSVPPALERPTPAAEVDGDRLRGLPFFSSFTPSELKDLLAPLSVRTLRRGRVLYSEGDEPASAFVCIRGAVEVAAGPRTAGHRVAVVGPGRLFGLVAPLDGGLRHTSAVIRENAIVLEIPCSEVRALLGADTAVAFKFSDAVLSTLIASLRSANRTLLCQAAMGRVSQRKKRAPSLLPL
jgi:CRP-like cAMP-binding protein